MQLCRKPSSTTHVLLRKRRTVDFVPSASLSWKRKESTLRHVCSLHVQLSLGSVWQQAACQRPVCLRAICFVFSR